jgi:hypothetical protein
MKFTDNTFTHYQCANPECNMTYTDRDLRSKISQKERLRLFENVSANSIEIDTPVKSMEVSDEYRKQNIDPDMPDPFEVQKHVNQVLGYPEW